MNMPAGVTSLAVAEARLPQTYEHAKQALTECVSIDECKDWADRAEAMASYARQSDDDTLFKMAKRIQERAVKRCGELLKSFDGRGQHRKGEGALPSSKDMATAAGLSEHQHKQAVRVANVPAETFEAAVESEAPPSITALADMGRKRMPEPPSGFREATHVLGTVKQFAEFCRANDPIKVAGGVFPDETARLREHVSVIDGWLDRFVTHLR